MMSRILTLLLLLTCLHTVAQQKPDFYYFADGRAVIKQDSLYGFINSKKEVVIPVQYNEAYSFNNAIAMVRRGYEVFAIDTAGNRLEHRIKTPRFKNLEFPAFAGWVRNRIPFVSSGEYERLHSQRVDVVVTIGKDGRIVSCEPAEGDNGTSDADDSNRAAFEKVREMALSAPAWSPARVDGQEVEIRHPMSISFDRVRPVKCYPVDDLGRRLHKDLTYPLFDGRYAYEFYKHFTKNIFIKKYSDYQKATSGVVYAAFTIDKTGKLRDIEIISSHNDVCSAKTVDILKKSPRWTPGTIDGKPVDVRYEMPFTYRFRNK